MFRNPAMALAFLSVILAVNAEEISLSGTVRKSGSAAGLPGVKVSLARHSNLSATTDAEGKFSITGTTAVLPQQQVLAPFQFNVRGKSIVFSPISGEECARVDVFSGSGKRIFSRSLIGLDKERQTVTLPNLSSGLNILKLTRGETSLTLNIVSAGEGIFLYKSETATGISGNTSLPRLAASPAVDTLIASKSGYTTKKLPVDSYTKSGIIIEMDSSTGAGGKCTRESLKAMVDKYIEAQTAGDPTKMPLAENVKIFINTKDSSSQKNILYKPLKIDFHLSIFDVDSCRTFTEVIVANSEPAYVIGTRLRVKDGKITEINAIVTDKNNGWFFDAAKYLKYAKTQNWYVLSESERISREKLIDAGNQYLDLFKGDTVDIPWGAPCYRIEGGSLVTLAGDTTQDNCKVDPKSLISLVNITNRDFIVDVELGAVDVFCRFCQLDSHLFRLVNGHFRYVHTLTVGCPK